MHCASERIRSEPQVVGFDGIFVPELIAALSNAPVRGSVTDDSNSCMIAFGNLGPRHERTGGFELAVQPLHVVFEIVGALAVLGSLVVSAATREVGRRGMNRSGQRAVADAVPVHIFV